MLYRFVLSIQYFKHTFHILKNWEIVDYDISGIYGEELDYVDERHRHRYEVNPKYVPELEQAGLEFVGQDAETGQRQEILEIPSHPFFLAFVLFCFVLFCFNKII
jgi:CTP synthase (UTP-ammonia lyase)